MGLFNQPISSGMKIDSGVKEKTSTARVLTEEELLVRRSLVKQSPFTNPVNRTPKGTPIPDDAYIQSLLSTAGQSKIDSRNILRMSPELERGANIYITGLLSPNDLSQSKINFNVEDGDFGPLRTIALEAIENYFRNEFKIDGRLKEWIFKARFSEGAVPLMVIPMTTIDRVINEKEAGKKKIALESYKSSFDEQGNYKPMGFLGAGVSQSTPKRTRSVRSVLGMESDTSPTSAVNGRVDFGAKAAEFLKDSVLIHDNVEALKIPQISIAAAQVKMEDYFSFTILEDEKPKNLSQEDSDTGSYEIKRDGVELYPQRHFELEQVVKLTPEDINANVGHPGFMELPYESVFAVHPPGKPGEHIGYYVALDESCNPLAIANRPSNNSLDMGTGSQGGNFASAVIDKGASAVGDTNFHMSAQSQQSQVNLFMSTMDLNMTEMLKNGVFNGTELALTQNNDIMMTMFQRALAGKKTQMLFVPKSLLTYIAFDFNEFGLGESKLSKHKDVAVLASIINLSNTLASISNAQQLKRVNIAFDEEDPDPTHTDEEIKAWLTKNQYGGNLLNSTRLADQLDMLVQGGYQFTYEGGMEIYPNTRVDIEPMAREVSVIDNDFATKIDKRMIMLTGVSPEIVDLTQDVEFAQSYITGNAIRAKEAHLEQLMFCEQLDRFVHSFVLNSKILMTMVVNLIKTKRREIPALKVLDDSDIALAKRFVKAIRTSLPKPDVNKLEMQLKSIETHSGFVDKILESYLNENLLNASEVGEKIAERADAIKAFFKDHLMRSYYQENNLVPAALSALFADEADDKVDVFLESEVLSKQLCDMMLNHEGVIARLRSNNDFKMNNLEERFGGGGDPNGGDSADNSTPADTDGDAAAAEPAAGGGEDGGDDLFGDDGSDPTDSPI